MSNEVYYGIEPYSGKIICHYGTRKGIKWGYSHGKLVDQDKVAKGIKDQNTKRYYYDKPLSDDYFKTPSNASFDINNPNSKVRVPIYTNTFIDNKSNPYLDDVKIDSYEEYTPKSYKDYKEKKRESEDRKKHLAGMKKSNQKIRKHDDDVLANDKNIYKYMYGRKYQDYVDYILKQRKDAEDFKSGKIDKKRVSTIKSDGFH